jgi:dihydroxyacetone kinase
MVDAIIPFRETLESEFAASSDLAASTKRAAAAAREAADATADFTARRGRSRVLGEKSVGTPDPGAVSFSLLMDALGDLFASAGAEQP